jgi:hypothetical protein
MEHYFTYARRKGLLLGVILISVGLIMILDRAGFIDSEAWLRYSPLLLVIAGINKIVDYKNAWRVASGFWLIFFGFWIFACLVHWGGLSFGNSWPFLLIGWGLMILIKSFIKTRFARVEAHHE